MGQLFLVRHGQASLDKDDYDQLSVLGAQQSRRLGEHWRELDLQFDAVACGTLLRHRQTLAGIAEGLQHTLDGAQNAGLNEYDAEAVIRSIHPEPRPRPTDPEAYRQHFRLLREGLLRWTTGSVQPEGMPAWSDFLEGTRSALEQVRQMQAESALVVSSGGPISFFLGHLLGMSPEASIELNLQMRNTAICELRTSAKGFRVVSFNTLPHLARAAHAKWISYA